MEREPSRPHSRRTPRSGGRASEGRKRAGATARALAGARREGLRSADGTVRPAAGGAVVALATTSPAISITSAPAARGFAELVEGLPGLNPVPFSQYPIACSTGSGWRAHARAARPSPGGGRSRWQRQRSATLRRTGSDSCSRLRAVRPGSSRRSGQQIIAGHRQPSLVRRTTASSGSNAATGAPSAAVAFTTVPWTTLAVTAEPLASALPGSMRARQRTPARRLLGRLSGACAMSSPPRRPARTARLPRLPVIACQLARPGAR